MNNLSLMSIMQSDDEFNRRIAKKVKEIKEDKQHLLDIANNYASKYQEEIIQGTDKRSKLLTEGKSRGLSEDEVLKEYGRFLPAIQTPVLNLLYFLLRESENDPYYGNSHYQERNRIDEQLGCLNEKEFQSEVLKDTPKMEEFLYGNLTLETFEIIKKLKRLSINNKNENEAFQAFRKANELCKKYDLKFDKIPV